MEYREASIDDIPSLIPLIQELGYQHTPESLQENFRTLKAHGGTVFVVCADTDIIGCVTAIIDVRFAGGVCGEIVSLVVSASARKCGYGKALITCAESWLKQRVSTVRVRANIIREQAHSFYQDRGYEEEKVQKVFKQSFF